LTISNDFLIYMTLTCSRDRKCKISYKEYT